jgi:diguanylate cyclase (GGDEF)-like protein
VNDTSGAVDVFEQLGFDSGSIRARLAMLGLDATNDRQLAEQLQQAIIRPNVDAIISGMLAALQDHELFHAIIAETSNVDHLANLLRHYLFRLGVNFEDPDYFADRLRIGYTHNRYGVPQDLYQSSFQTLQYLLINHVPRQIRSDEGAFDRLLRFILRITSLDMSLAVESYCNSRVCKLEDTLQTERGVSARMRKLAITDWLTSLHNHSYSRDLLRDALAASQEAQSSLCIILADLDHFKRVNDTHGHLVGDHVLRLAAARMTTCARAGDEIGRYGGEEFLFVLNDTTPEAAAEVAERVRTRLEEDVVHYKQASIQVTLSLGIAKARQDDTVDSLIERADAALYAAKVSGRNRAVVEPAA